MATEQELFGIRSLNGKVEAFGQDSLRTRVFTSVVDKGRDLGAEDGTLEWDEKTFSRSLAPVVGHDSPFPERQLLQTINRRSAVAHIKESKIIPARKLYYERESGGLRPNATAVVEEELRDLTNRLAATVEYMASNTLQGSLVVNAANIPGTTIPFTITYTTNAYTAANSWATAGTGILSAEIPALKQDFEQFCGFVPTQVLIGSTIEGFIVGNTEVTTLSRNQLGDRFVTQSGVLNGPMLGGLAVGGLTWDVTEGGYTPDGGAFTRFLPTTDRGIVLPADSELGEVLGLAQGRGFIPQSNLVSDANATSQVAAMVRPASQMGFYTYATRVDNPAGVRIYAGWVGLPILLRPAAVQVLNLIP